MVATDQKAATKKCLLRARTYLEAVCRKRSVYPFYGIGGVLLLCLLMGVGFTAIRAIHSSFWINGFRDYWYYDSPLSVLLVGCIVLYHRPHLLALSRWQPRWIDVILGALLGLLVPAVLFITVRSPIQTLHLRPLPRSSFLPIVLIAPMIEEIVCRGIFLKSLKSYLPRLAAIVIVTVLIAFGHNSFWVVLPSQLMFSIIYIALGDSLPASMVAHVVNNAFVFIASSGNL